MSLAAALVLTAVVGSSMRSELPSLFATTFVAGFLLGAILPDGIVAVLACAYLVPAVVLACVGTYPAEYHTLWVVALFGAVLPQSARRPWMLPSPWRVPFVGWAVAIAVTWPLIVAREVDFNAAQLTSFSLSTSAFGIRTPT